MDENRFIWLLTRRMSGEITEQESAELDRMFAEYSDLVYYEQLFREVWKKKEYSEVDIDKKYEHHRERHGMDAFSGAGAHRESSLQKVPFSRKLGAKSVIGIAATVAFLMIGTVWVFMSDRFFTSSNVRNQTEIAAEKGIRKALQLPDGTKVWLNADSRLTYANFDKSTGERRVFLEGEAFFDVVKDENRPFFVKTEKFSIKVLGTSFNVKAYPCEPETETTLLTGSIELFVNERPDEIIRLKPNEKLSLQENREGIKRRTKNQPNRTAMTIGNPTAVQIGDTEYIQETSWTQNKLIFRNETFDKIIPKLERWYGVNIQLEDDEIGTYLFTGTVTGERIDEILTAMQLVNNFEFKIENHDVNIY